MYVYLIRSGDELSDNGVGLGVVQAEGKCAGASPTGIPPDPVCFVGLHARSPPRRRPQDHHFPKYRLWRMSRGICGYCFAIFEFILKHIVQGLPEISGSKEQGDA